MKTFLPQNQFLNPSVIPESPTEGPAVASSDLQPRATAEVIEELMCVEPSLIRVLDAGRSGRTDCSTIDSIVRDPEDGAVKAWSPGPRAVTGDNSVSPGVYPGSLPSGEIEPDATSVSAPGENLPSMTNGGDQETPTSAPTKNPAVGVLEATCKESLQVQDGATDCIHEIFHWVRKLMDHRTGDSRFELNQAAFMAEVEEEPLFLRDGDHLRRWEA